MDATSSPTTRPLYRGTQIAWFLLSLVEVILALRFALKLLGANAAAGFTRFIYTLTAVLVDPFVSVFHITDVLGTVFEWTTLLAMFVYWLLAVALVRLLLLGRSVSTPEAAARLDQEDK